MAVLLQPLARLPLVAFGTGAVEVLVHAVASGLVLTRVWITSIRGGPAGDLTQLSGKLWRALTHKAVQHCVTLAAVLAWSAVALVPLDFTVSAHETWTTMAVVTLRTLLACCSILALTMAAIDVDVTVLSGPSPKTVAVISANQIFARISVHTGISCTLICIYLAGLSLPLWRAHALEAILQVDAGSTLSTRTGGTLVQIVGTGRTLPARRTMALEPRGDLVACTTVGARVGNTGVLGYFTGLAGVSLRTGAVVLIRFGVHAGSSIDTRLVATAVI